MSGQSAASSSEDGADARSGEPRAPWVAVALVAGSVLLSTMDSSIINIALPTLASEFGTTIDAVVWVVLIFVLLGTGLALPFGRLGDLFGRKRFYVAGNAVVALGLLACGLAPSLPLLVAARGLQAVGNAMVVSNGNAIVTAAVAPQHRGQALGIIGGIVGIGLASGPVLGGIFLELLNWRAIFLVRLPLSLALTALLWLVLRDTPSEGRDRGLDVPGSLALFGSLASLTLAVNRGHAWGWSSPSIIGLFALGLALAPLFVLIERRAASPVVSLELLRIRAFSGSVGSAILFFWGFAAVLVLMPFYLVDARGFSTLEAGAILAAQPLTLFVFAPLTGRLADRTGPGLLVPLGLTSASLGIALLALVDGGTSVPDVAARLALIGLGMALFQSPNNSTIMSAVPTQRLGMASAAIVTARRIGQAGGIAVSGAVFTAAAGANLVAAGEGSPLRALAIIDGLEAGLLFSATVVASAIAVYWRWGTD